MRDGGTGLFSPEKFKGATWEFAIYLRRELNLPPVESIDRRQLPRHVAWLTRGRDDRDMNTRVFTESSAVLRRLWGADIKVEELTSDVLRSRNNPRALLEAMATVDVLVRFLRLTKKV